MGNTERSSGKTMVRQRGNPLPETVGSVMKESLIVDQCIKWLWAHGCYVYRQNTGAYKPEGSNRYIRYGTPGGSDIVGVSPYGRALFIECKTAKGQLTPLQEAFRERIEEKNGIYILARSIDDLEAFKTAILAKQYPPMYAQGAVPDHRIKPTSKHGAVV